MSAPNRHRVARAFGVVLKTARMGAGLSQHQLARAANLSNNFSGRLERGQQEPTLSTLLALADALGVHATLLVAMTQGRLRREMQP